MAKLGTAEAEVIRQWCASPEGQRRIQALLDELDEAVVAIRERERALDQLIYESP